MEISSIGHLSSRLKAAETSEAVKTEVMRKTMAIQKQHASDLMQAIPKPNANSNPPHLGQSIDVHA